MTTDLRVDCPNCGIDLFYEGPHGGLSVNVQCAGCGKFWNFLGPFGFQAIESNVAYFKGTARKLEEFV